jgi:AcrR family transcriptional regulator
MVALVAGGGALGRERIGELQRARILAAITELVREGGIAGVTVAHIVARSGVSRRTFYELFDDREDCLLAAFDHAVERAAAVVVPAWEGAYGGNSWQERIRTGLGALLEFLDEEPALGGLCVVDALAADRGLLEHRMRVVGQLVAAVHQGAAAGALRGAAETRRGSHSRPPRIVAEGVVGAVLAIIHARLSQRMPGTDSTRSATPRVNRPQPLSGLLNELMGIVVLPYLGPAAAVREQKRRRSPTRRIPPAPRPADPLRELDMRLTYRTVRVLIAVAERPAANGRQIAEAAGIQDQGQMSKLLRRLEHLGLIENAAPRRGTGEANAWSLTPRGQEIERAIRAQTRG